MKFACIYDDEHVGLGNTLEDAFSVLKDNHDDSLTVDDVDFFEMGKQIKVQMKLVPIVVPAEPKTINKGK